MSCTQCGKTMSTGPFAKYSDLPSTIYEGICRACGQGEIDPEILERERLAAERRGNEDKLAAAMLISTTSEIHGQQIIEHLGVARGGTVRAKNAVSDFGAGLKNIVGGELKAYTKLLADAREEALYRMKFDAVMMNADAVIGVQFSTAMIDVGAAEISAYGTAVKLMKAQKDG
jgi:uncharacterized protein YbjQ (UPF0145 family)